jgi:hypothetical protein
MDTGNFPPEGSKQTKVTQIDVSLSLRERLQYLYPSILAMVFSLAVTFLVVSTNPLLNPGILPPTLSPIDTLIMISVIGLAGGLATLVTFYIFQHGSELLHRVLIAAFVSPLFFILTVFFGQAILLLLLFQGLNTLHLSFLALASIMFSTFSLVFIFTDALGSTARNVLFVFYGIILGVFLAVSFTSLISLAILIILAIQDTLFAMKLGPTMVDVDRKVHARSAFTFVIGPLIIGVGDLIVYAALVSYALRYFGWIFAGITFITILIGCLINTQIVAKYPNQAIPGLPAPMMCALIPIGIGLATFFLFGVPIPFP